MTMLPKVRNQLLTLFAGVGVLIAAWALAHPAFTSKNASDKTPAKNSAQPHPDNHDFAGTLSDLSSSRSTPTNQPPAISNLHLIDKRPNGFAIYRSGAPSQEAFEEWCKLGVSEVMVLSGNASRYEHQYQKLCPQLKVVYDEKQDVAVPVTASFLNVFDAWVSAAQNAGKAILFRCNCGCHRTGRVAAYYEMKYLGYTYSQAHDNLMRYGENMQSYPFLPLQIRALHDYIDRLACGQPALHCVGAD